MRIFLCSLLFGFSIAARAQVPASLISPARLAEIQRVADNLSAQQLFSGIAIHGNSTVPGPAWSQQLPTGSFEIQYNPVLLQGFAPSATDLVLYHELGHVRLGHHSLLKQQPTKAHDLELEADAFAAFVFRRRGRVDEGLVKFLQVVASRTGTVPSGPERVRVFAPLLGLPLPSSWR